MKPGGKAERTTPPTIGAERALAARSALLVAAVAALVTVAVADPATAGDSNYAHQSWYVSATAAAGGDGSANAPFNSLALVQQASGPGDTIMIEPSPVSVPPLDGGIVLKAGQRLIGGGPPIVKFGAPLIFGGPPVVGPSGLSSLPRITNTSAAANSGDAVRLADDTDVENLVITGAYRGAIYGQDVVGVTVRGNDLSGFNTSGTVGFVVQPFFATTYIAGTGVNVATGVRAGWAAILIDAANVSTTLSIANNYLHDGVCGDGIDIRGMNTGDIGVQVNYNFITRLVQCGSVSAIQGISTQVTGTSRLRATLFGNTQADNGSPGANMDRLFVNPAESGTLVETIDQNVDITGIGGASTNGFEYIVSNGGGTSQVTISNSFFRDNPGDTLQELNFGEDGARATLILDHVVVELSTIDRGLPSYAIPPGTLTGATNTGDCLDIVANGANDTTIFRMTDSSFTGCDNNGIEVTGNHVTGNGVGDLHTIVLDIDNSVISGSRFYNLWINDLTPLTSLRARVQDSDLSVSSSGVAVAFDQQPTGATASAVIDLGGGALGSDGRNCIFGGAIYDLEATRYNVSVENNWWGTAKGPLAGKVVETVPGYKIDASKPLRRAPPACNGEEPSR